MSMFDKQTLKFCMMLPKHTSTHAMYQRLFSYDSISYLLLKSTRFKIFQKINAIAFLQSIYKKYAGDDFTMTIIVPYHLANDLALSRWVTHKPNVHLLLTHHFHMLHQVKMKTQPSTTTSLIDYDNHSLKNTLTLNPIKVPLSTLSKVKHRYIFASLVHLDLQTIQVFIDAFLSIQASDLHLYIELLNTSFLPHSFEIDHSLIHVLPSMTNKERTSYIQHAYVNLLAIDHHQPKYKVIYFDMLLQLLAHGIPLISTPQDTLTNQLDLNTYWLNSLALSVVKKAFLHIIHDDYSAMLQVAISNQSIVEKKYSIQASKKGLNAHIN
jgi:hypothetical protein